MFENVYQTLSTYGYAHPLHPISVHLSVGLIVGAVIFALISVFFKRKASATTAKHCMALSFFSLIPTILLGVADWRHFYGGSWLFEIKMKVFLACLLVIIFVLLFFLNRKAHSDGVSHLPLYIVCFLIVGGIGYFGGELVFGQKGGAKITSKRSGVDSALVSKGGELFSQRCAFCHYADKTDIKFGPGLKGLFTLEKFSVSGAAVTTESVQKQLVTPFKDMPAFDRLTADQINALTEYLKTL